MKANWDEFQHLCRTHLHHSVINDADDPMSLFTSAVSKHLNKAWFSDICKDAIKEHKHEPTEGNLNTYHITRAKAHSKI